MSELVGRFVPAVFCACAVSCFILPSSCFIAMALDPRALELRSPSDTEESDSDDSMEGAHLILVDAESPLVLASSQAVLIAEGLAEDSPDEEWNTMRMVAAAFTDSSAEISVLKTKLKACQRQIKTLVGKSDGLAKKHEYAMKHLKNLGVDRRAGEHLVPRRAFALCLKAAAGRASLQ